MDFFRKSAHTISHMMIIVMLSLGLNTTANAGMISTTDIITEQQAEQQRDYVQTLLERDDIKTRLISMGVDADEAVKRVDSMTHDEVQQLAGRLEETPAGSGVLGVLGLILVVLLITDLLNVTNVYNL